MVAGKIAWNTEVKKMSGASSQKDMLFVIGMHRSGTSALTGVLSLLGVNLGGRLYGAHKGVNEKGYYEHSDIANTNDELLYALGSCWDDILAMPDCWWEKVEAEQYIFAIKKIIQRDFTNSPLWALKDPRICRLLPLYQKLIRDLGFYDHYLFMTRHPLEVAKSLQRRNGFSRDKSLLLWIEHILPALIETQSNKRVFFNFEDLLNDTENELHKIETELEIAFPKSIDDSMVEINRFLTRDLKHHQGLCWEDEESSIGALARDLYSIVSAVGRDAGSIDDDEIKKIERDLTKYCSCFDAVMVEHIRSLAKKRGELQLTNFRVFRSWTWALGKPLRWFERLLSRDI